MQWRNELPENTYDNRDLEKAFVELARPMYQSKVPPSLSLWHRAPVVADECVQSFAPLRVSHQMA